MAQKRPATWESEGESSKFRSINGEEKSFEDYFSQLPDDCLLDIFSRINHIDLDEVATLNSKMSVLSDSSRSTAVKFDAFKLVVSQAVNQKYSFAMHYPNHDLTLQRPDSNSTMNLCNWDGDRSRGILISPQTRKLSGILTERTIRVINKFDFKSCFFESIQVANHFLSLIQPVISLRKLVNINFVQCTFNVSDVERKRFVSLLHSVKPLSIHFNCHALFIGEEFLKDYAKTVPLCSLTLVSQTKNPIHITAHCAGFISEYMNLDIRPFQNFTFDTDWLLQPLLKRLRHKQRGVWKFAISKDFCQNEVVAALDADLEFTPLVPGVFCISIVDTDREYRVTVYTELRAEGEVWAFSADFQI